MIVHGIFEELEHVSLLHKMKSSCKNLAKSPRTFYLLISSYIVDYVKWFEVSHIFSLRRIYIEFYCYFIVINGNKERWIRS